MRPYELALSESAAKALAEATRAEQRRLGVILDDLKTDPFRRGDLQEQDARGRTHEVLLVGDWLVTFWREDRKSVV